MAQVVAPQSNVDEILTELHGARPEGTLGRIKMDKIRQRYY